MKPAEVVVNQENSKSQAVANEGKNNEVAKGSKGGKGNKWFEIYLNK